jgi:hypothetical protein
MTPRAIRRMIVALLVVAMLGLAGFLGWAWMRNHPQELPWTRLDLRQPTGTFTRAKLAALGGEFAECRAMLDAARVRYEVLPPRAVAGQAECGFADGVRFTRGGARTSRYAPDSPAVSCRVAAAASMWEWNVVQPAALTRFGKPVTRIEHFGSYNCRRIYGRSEGVWSQHATANALDVAGFILSDGTRIGVLEDWNEGGDKAAFLREVRNGACRLFSTTLSPDYNAAHANHFHLDMGGGGTAWSVCR